MDAIPAISGSSPAYVYMLIEALADGGVKQGIAREQAYRLAAQAVLGAAKMVLETQKYPKELIHDVCTPGGATIEAVAELERKQFRGAILSAMECCDAKIKEISTVQVGDSHASNQIQKSTLTNLIGKQTRLTLENIGKLSFFHTD